MLNEILDQKSLTCPYLLLRTPASIASNPQLPHLSAGLPPSSLSRRSCSLRHLSLPPKRIVIWWDLRFWPPVGLTPKRRLPQREREMQQRNSGNRRPSGTDGSDFSYRMVVDNRYTKVAKGKSSLSKVLVIQAVVVFIGVLDIPFTLLKKEPLETLYAASSSLTFISIIIGELGRKRSRVKLLKLYMVASSIGLLGSIASIIQNNTQLKVISEKFVVLKIACVFAGLLIQIFSIYKTTSLIGNMSPPKRAS